MGNESEQLTLKAMFYREHRSFAPSRYFAVFCPIILAVDARRVKRDSKWTFGDGDERNSKGGAPLRCKFAAVLEAKNNGSRIKGCEVGSEMAKRTGGIGASL